MSGVGLAAVYMSPLTNYLLKVISIPQTFLILGLGTIVLIALLAQALTNGALFTAFGVAGVTGSVLGGRVRDRFGSYTYAFITCGIMLLVGAVLAFLLKAPKLEPAPLSASPASGPERG